MFYRLSKQKKHPSKNRSDTIERVKHGIRKEWIRGFKTAFPVMLSFIPFGLLLGAQAKIHGMTIVELVLMCSVNFAGGSEFVAIGLWQHTPPLLLIVAMTLLVNCRHILMSATMIRFCRRFSTKRILLSFFFLCDECWALSLQDSYHRLKHGYSHAFSYSFYLSVGVYLYLTWVLSALLGILLGPVLGDLSHYGFDMAFAAIFIVLLRGMWQGWQKAVPWFISLVVACLAYLMIPGEWYVIAGTLAGLGSVFLMPSHWLQKSEYA